MEEQAWKCAECERVERQRSDNMNLCRNFNQREKSLRWELSVVKQQLDSANENILSMAKLMNELQKENAKLRGEI